MKKIGDLLLALLEALLPERDDFSLKMHPVMKWLLLTFAVFMGGGLLLMIVAWLR